MSDFIDAFNGIPEKNFQCPLQILHKHVKGETRFNKYYNDKCLNCVGNMPVSEKSINHRLTDTMIKFKIMSKLEQLVEIGKLIDTDDELNKELDDFETFMKMSGQQN